MWLLFGTRFGIAVTAVHDDERVADLMGIDVRAFQIAAFALGSAIAGIGGGLYAHHFSFIEAQYFNVSLSITIVLYVLLGGTQTVLGPLWSAPPCSRCCRRSCAPARNWRYVRVRRRPDRHHGAAARRPGHRRAGAPAARLAAAGRPTPAKRRRTMTA